MNCGIAPINELKNYKYVIVISVYQENILLSKHRGRDTWETQGGHIESGEEPLDAAKRELFEESGALEFDIRPIFDYWAGDEKSVTNGVVFVAHINKLGELPESEMEKIGQFSLLPDKLTYPDIIPKIYQYALRAKLLTTPTHNCSI